MDTEKPDDATVLASVQRVEPMVLGGIRSNRRRRRGVTVGLSVLAGVGLFAGGVAVGAAAMPPSPNPGANPGVMVDGAGHVLQNQFAIDCYASISPHAQFSEMDESQEKGQGPSAAERADEKDPAKVCATMESQQAINDAVGSEANRLIARGVDEGFIQVTGGAIWHFEKVHAANGQLALSLDDGLETRASGVHITAVIRSPLPPFTSRAVCEVASNWVKVYPLGSGSADSVCASVGLQAWSGQ